MQTGVLCEVRTEYIADLWLGAHWQLQLLNYLVARMENAPLYESARTGNFSVAETKKLQLVAA